MITMAMVKYTSRGRPRHFAYLTNHVGVFALGDADAVSAAGHAHPDVLLPMGGIQTVDADNDLGIAVIDGLQSVIQ